MAAGGLPGKPFVPFADALGYIAKERSVVEVLHLDWNLNSTFVNDGITARDVELGKTDAYVRAFARDLRNYGRPVLMTVFNGEFNGSWWYSVSRARTLS